MAGDDGLRDLGFIKTGLNVKTGLHVDAVIDRLDIWGNDGLKENKGRANKAKLGAARPLLLNDNALYIICPFGRVKCR